MEELTLDEVDEAWGNADFGSLDKMDVIKLALLKRACNYHNGFTATQILTTLGLVTPKNNLTKRGKYCLYWMFRKNVDLT